MFGLAHELIYQMHARSIGPLLVTQLNCQGGKAQFQRAAFGEMKFGATLRHTVL
jgi:DNA-directed RNA polymerase beta subunit